jgi:predicted acylesterase/phospholipase RssA
MSVTDKMNKTGPRKLLTIDGGGIRGMLSVEILARIEQILRDAHNDESLKLCDYFDYIAGTSTGAIIAAALSWGMEVEEVREFYEKNGKAMFESVSWWEKLRSLGASKFHDDNLSQQLQEVFTEETADGNALAELGSEKLKTLLMVVVRNATTDSPWPLSNNPKAEYNDPALDDCNLKLPLWQLVRASTAANMVFVQAKTPPTSTSTARWCS